MKTKIKTKTKKKAPQRKSRAVKTKTAPKAGAKKPRHYHPSYMAILIAGILLLEGLLFSVATPTDWKYGVQILDLRPAVAEAANDMAEMFSPVLELTYSVNRFYVAASDEMVVLMDFSGLMEGVADIYYGAGTFYDQASVAMADLLGVSTSTYYGSVAGASIQK